MQNMGYPENKHKTITQFVMRINSVWAYNLYLAPLYKACIVETS